MRLTWHDYSYYPYERDLATREIVAVLEPGHMREVGDGIELRGVKPRSHAGRLTYFSGSLNGSGFEPTVQAKLEEAGRSGKNRQSTRYSVHGLHEYKGKFNPQVVRAMLNIFGVQPRQRVLDPFCGSGTTLVECAHLGALSVGTDVNPLAVSIARAKMQALRTPVAQLLQISGRLHTHLSRKKRTKTTKRDNPRMIYLESWFDAHVLEQIECVRSSIEEVTAEKRLIFLIVASNLLRDYSKQDPNDLRTRRRRSALPDTPFTTAFLNAIPPLLERIEATQIVLGTDYPPGDALLHDVTAVTLDDVGGYFDAAVTSPPYAMALPYIDTQRLSLVWLGLCQPGEIGNLDAKLVGSRELRGGARRDSLRQLLENAYDLPSKQSDVCIGLHNALDEQDGFRRQAVPLLLYRYFAFMRASFRAVKTVLTRGAPYGLIVGHNRTTIGGIQYKIDTPAHLSSLAAAEGWRVEDVIPLQTYRRYGYHVSNAVAAETLIILRNV